jgi:colanic acid/amylovoran biosynthesis glycosyltransferase
MDIKVLHVVRTYLPLTENWLYNLWNFASDIRHSIYCEIYKPPAFSKENYPIFTLPPGYEPVSGNTIMSKIHRFFTKWKLQLSGNTKQQYFLDLITKENPDILHFHFGTMSLAYKSSLLKMQTPFVVSFYGYDYNTVYHYNHIFEKAKNLICEGNAGKEQLIHAGCPASKIVIVPLGIVPADSIKEHIKLENSLHLVQIASFTEKKGHIYTLKALEKAIQLYPDISLTLIGPDSSLKKEIASYIAKRKLEKNVTVKDAISPDILNEELMLYDVFIHPSVTAQNGDNEGGAPVVLLNAQNCGLPVISTFHKDIPDYVIHNQTGLLAPEKDIDMLSRFIIEFYTMKRDTFQHFSNNARKHVHTNYDIRVNAQKLSSLYHSILKT